MSTFGLRRQAARASRSTGSGCRWGRQGSSRPNHFCSLYRFISTLQTDGTFSLTLKLLHKGKVVIGGNILEVSIATLKVHAIDKTCLGLVLGQSACGEQSNGTEAAKRRSDWEHFVEYQRQRMKRLTVVWC